TAWLTAARSLSGRLPASRTTTRPSRPKPSAPESKCGRRVASKRCAMRAWMAWIAGVRMVMSGCCAWASPTTRPSSAISSGSRTGSAAPESGCGAAGSSPITLSTNSRAACSTSAAGKYTLMVTQALSSARVAETARTASLRIGILLEAWFAGASTDAFAPIHHRRLPGGCGLEPSHQHRPVHAALVADHGDPRQARAFDDSVAAGPNGRFDAAHGADVVLQPAAQPDLPVGEGLEHGQQLRLQAAGEATAADRGQVADRALADPAAVGRRGGRQQLGVEGDRFPVHQAQAEDAPLQPAADLAEAEGAGQWHQVEVVQGKVGHQ